MEQNLKRVTQKVFMDVHIVGFRSGESSQAG
jgi:hypothetical protein